ncbi:hypothetical protein D9C73_024767 [Collichthys lucidus]|uniref:Uncharacterized protein n=1 Tax=Collichthys lucidus TaxID=240159 RepID=A0A4U5VPW9_COLLU|nr:hypothetical protein D9C73_024767 [Collichthys lucidus]
MLKLQQHHRRACFFACEIFVAVLVHRVSEYEEQDGLVITQIKSLLVYDRQFLLDLRHNVRTLDAFEHGGQKTVPPTHLFRALALPPRQKRLRGKRGGRLVKLKAWLAGSSTIPPQNWD